jgi:hypothetical protein
MYFIQAAEYDYTYLVYTQGQAGQQQCQRPSTRKTTPHPLTHIYTHPGEGVPQAARGGEEGGTSMDIYSFLYQDYCILLFRLGSRAIRVREGWLGDSFYR